MKIFDALREGKQISNGPQSISWDTDLKRGYLWCDTPGCCDRDFDSLAEIKEFVGNDDSDWEILN